jgi:hypothetical protein
LIFYALYIGVALIFSLGFVLQNPQDILGALMATRDLNSFSEMADYSMIDLVSGIFIFVLLHIWWTSMWAATSAVAYAEQRIDDKIRYETHMESYRQGSYQNTDLRQLRKDRERD